MIKIIALFGESGSGKDTIQNWIVSEFSETAPVLRTTTRPKREKDIDGETYHFIAVEKFGEKVLDGTMLDATVFNGDWYYGTAIEDLDEDKINIGVFNIESINCLLEDKRLDIIPVYIWTPDKSRLLRALNREEKPDCQEICRRFLADKKDFADENIEFDYLQYYNKDNTPFDKTFWANIIKEK